MRLDRTALIDAITSCVHAQTWIHGAWLGGSDATGRVDEYSDVDLQLIVPDERVEEAFGAIEAMLDVLGGVAHRWRLPEPTWHSHAQAVYLLKNAPPCCSLDLSVMKRSSGVWFTERERHGEIVVLIDRANLLAPLPLDKAEFARRRAAHRMHLEASLPVRLEMVRKAIERGQVSEASMRYHTHVLRPLIDLLRLQHDPDRFDFGERYLDRDFPEAKRILIEELSLPGSMVELRSVFARAKIEIERLLPSRS